MKDFVWKLHSRLRQQQPINAWRQPPFCGVRKCKYSSKKITLL